MRAIGLDVHLEFCEVAIAEGGSDPLRRADRGQAGRARAVRPKPRQGRPRRARGHRQRLGDQAPARAPRRRGGRRLAKRHRDPLGAGEDRSPRRPRPGEAPGRRRARRGLGPRPKDPGDAPSASAPKPARRRAHAGKERDPCGTDAPARRPAAVHRPVRQEGAAWLSELELAEVERESVDAALRQVEFLDSEIAEVERLIAAEALKWPEVRRLMTVPGVNVICAATFMAAIGDVGRFESARKLVGYLGLDPRVAQSGSGSRRTGGSQSRALQAPATRWSRRAGRRSASPARSAPSISGSRRAAATRSRSSPRHASSPACFGVLLTREEDYAFGQPSMTRKKLRLAELRAGAPSRKGIRTGKWVAGAAMREAERAAAEQAEAAYKRTVSDWQATQAKKEGAGATPGRASSGPSSGQAARQNEAPNPAL